MSIVVKCDYCDREVGPDQNRVILQATRYVVYDEAEAPPQPAMVSAASPPGTPTPAVGQTAPQLPMTLFGSDKQFLSSDAASGQVEMHEDCWEEWFNNRRRTGVAAASESREDELARQAAERESEGDDENSE